MAHDRDKWNSDYKEMALKYEAEQLEELQKKEKMEQDTKELGDYQRKKRENAILDATRENNRQFKALEDENKRKAYWKSPDGRENKAQIDNQAIIERDIASGMSMEEIKVRNEERLELQRGHKRKLNDPVYSADPQKHFKRRLK